MTSARLRLRALVFCVASLVVGCFDPEISRGGDDTSGDASGSESVDPSLDATSPTVSTTIEPTTEASATLDESSSSGVPPECESDEDCAEAGECEVATCPDGTCVVEPLEVGAPCGDDATSDCDAADSCDGKGECIANLAQDGVPCSGCALGLCGCAAGVCDDCTPAPSNNFITPRSTAGWELTGSWALYREAPQSQYGPAIRFAGQVLGTDGNRSQPYPGPGESETSYARSGPTVLPATLELLSWHVDEGGAGDYDRKSISISVDEGVTWLLVADCTINPGLPFCPGVTDRAADAWDAVSIPVPIDLQGMIGRIELAYATGDECCQGERGWYVDAANFGSECGCAGDEACAAEGGECGDAVCGATGECSFDAVVAGTACGDDELAQCTAADTCDGVGYCDAHDQATGLTTCTDCPAGAGACQTCLDGACNDCAALVDPNGFDGGEALAGWISESPGGTGNDWRLYSQAPPNTVAGSLPIAFASTVFGTDGNRVAPYDTAVDPFNRQTEISQTTTGLDTIPASITFDSWHVDEGNNVDNKTIQVSVDDGASWNVLVDCNNVADQALYPFCISRLDDRPADAWDAISVDTGAFAGQTGRLRLTYDTVDDCCENERGWYLDNLSFASYCLDPLFP